MIQEAHVGIGIAGKEGLQAARVSDYSIGQFRFLQRLLLVHGRWNYMRTAKYILGTFWKEMLFYLTQALYQVCADDPISLVLNANNGFSVIMVTQVLRSMSRGPCLCSIPSSLRCQSSSWVSLNEIYELQHFLQFLSCILLGNEMNASISGNISGGCSWLRAR